LLTWGALVLLLAAAAVSLVLIVHRQWAHHERLRYPIADLATTLIGTERERLFSPMLRSRLFWAGLLVVFSVHFLNHLHAWVPGVPHINLRLTFPQLIERYPQLNRIPGGRILAMAYIYPTAIAFGFFLASEVGLSLGISQVLFVIVAAVLTRAGVDLSGTERTGSIVVWQRFGSYLAIGLMLVYLGRRYYGQVLRAAMLPWWRQPVEPYAIWACRVLLVFLLSPILAATAREGLLAFFLNGLRICDVSGIRPERIGLRAYLTFALALAVAVPVALWADYNYGALSRRSTVATIRDPKATFAAISQSLTELRVSDRLGASEELGALQRLGMARPKGDFLWAVGFGIAAVLIVGFLRLRCPWWFLHPVLFPVWDTYAMRLMACSFLLGWLARTVLIRLGGQQKYRQGRAFMMGVVAGDILGALTAMVTGGIYHALTGLMPELYNVYPM